MKIGMGLRNMGEAADRETLTRCAQAAEEAKRAASGAGTSFRKELWDRSRRLGVRADEARELRDRRARTAAPVDQRAVTVEGQGRDTARIELFRHAGMMTSTSVGR